MPQKPCPSPHIPERFMPYLRDEKRLMEVLRITAATDFNRNVEVPTFRIGCTAALKMNSSGLFRKEWLKKKRIMHICA